ncbi:MAG: iron-sulfur cluster assembly scaffold protein [Pseudomonadota bacterium]
MLNDLYSDALLEAAADIPEEGVLSDADASARRSSKVCGSEVGVTLKMQDGVVADIALEVKACALGQASSSILARHIRGASPTELYRVREEMLAMLKKDGPPPQGERWAALEKLQPIKDYPARHASTMLVFEAVVDCLERIADKCVRLSAKDARQNKNLEPLSDSKGTRNALNQMKDGTS